MAEQFSMRPRTLNREKIAEQISAQLGLSKREAKEILGRFFVEIEDALAQGDSVKLSGFGSFILRAKSERMGRNPKTRKAALISARQVVLFRPAQKLKVKVKNHVGPGN